MPHHRTPRAAVAVATGLAGLLVGLPAGALADTTVVISGTVTDGSGSALRWGNVEVHRASDGGLVKTGTLVSGEYAVEVAPGDYKLQFAGYGAVPEFYQDKPDLASATVVAAVADTRLPVVALADTPRLRGRVVAPGDNPVAGTLYAYREDAPGSGTFDTAYDLWRRFDSRTDDVLVEDLPPGRYKLQVDPDSDRLAAAYVGGADLAHATVVETSATGAQVGTIAVAERPVVSGTITDEAGLPLDNATVELYRRRDDGTFAFSEGHTVYGGRYEVPVDPGVYRLRFTGSTIDELGEWVTATPEWYGDQPTDATTPSVTVAADVRLDQIRLALPATPTVRGVVRNSAGQGIAGVAVTLWEVVGGTDYQRSVVHTRTDGSFATRVRPGVYKIQLADDTDTYLREWYGDADYRTDARTITVPATGYSITEPVILTRAGRISGTVRDAAGHPVGAATVYVLDAVNGGTHQLSTTATGAYTATGLRAGSYRVLVEDGSYASTYYGDTTQLPLAAEVVLGPEQSAAGRDITLVDQPAPSAEGTDVTGIVTDDAGRPLRGVEVLAFRADDPTTFVGSASTDTAGRYRLRDLDRAQPSSYRLQLVPAPPASGELRVLGAWLGGKRYPAQSPAVTVTRGAAPVVANQALRRQGALRGRLTVDGGSLDQGWVEAYDERGESDSWVETHGDGTYTLMLDPGTYTVYAGSLGHYPSWYRGADAVTATRITVRSGAVVSSVDVRVTDRFSALTRPTVTGTPVVGGTLRATTGAWNLGPADFDVQWLRGTTVVGHGTTYRPVPADLGRRIAVRVLASVEDRSGTAASAPTAPVTAPAVRSRVVVTGRSARRRTVVLTVAVSAPGIARPRGTVVVKDGRTLVASRTLTGTRLTLTLRQQRKGSHRYAVTYSGTAGVTGSAATAAVRVR